MTSEQKKRIGCLGSGRLYQAVVSHLEQLNASRGDRTGAVGAGSAQGKVPVSGTIPTAPVRVPTVVRIESIEDLPLHAAECSMILYCDDQWHFQTQHKINEQCLQLGLPWLRAYCEFGTGIIGPCVDPSDAGCVACVELRRRAAMRDATDFVLLCQQDETVGTGLAPVREQPWLTNNHLEILAQLVVGEVSTYLQTPDLIQTRRASLYLDLDTLHYQRHRFLPEPECLACGRMVLDTSEGA